MCTARWLVSCVLKKGARNQYIVFLHNDKCVRICDRLAHIISCDAQSCAHPKKKRCTLNTKKRIKNPLEHSLNLENLDSNMGPKLREKG